MNTPFYKQIWFLGGLAALVIFALCFYAIDYVSRPDGPKKPDVEMAVIATMQTNEPLITLARQQGWIEPDATEMTTEDALEVDSIGTVFAGSNLQSFSELRYFVCLQDIKAGAFAYAEKLKDIVIPASVTNIEDGAFAYCPSLETISVDTANTHYDSRENCNGIICTWKGKLMLVAGCKNTTLPERVYFLAPQAFAGCTGLTHIDFPERMEAIGEQAFADCTSLKEVEIPQGVRFVEPGTFMGCSALESVTLSKSVERLQQDAFKGCASLKKIITPKRFPPVIEQAFESYTATVYVPKDQQNAYFRDKVWKMFKDYKELP